MLTLLRTTTLYGIARLQHLVSVPILWRGVGIVALAGLAVIGTSVAWRARTNSPEAPAAADFGLDASLAPAASAAQELADPPPPAATSSQEDLPTAPVEIGDETVNPFTGQSVAEERASRLRNHDVATFQHQLEITRAKVQIAEQEKELARLQQETRAITHPSRAPAPPPPPPVPQMTVLGVSSTAALVSVGAWRGIVRPGTTIGGWTVRRLEPTGVTLTHQRRQAFVPLSFHVFPASQ
jgi:hypothetical protein